MMQQRLNAYDLAPEVMQGMIDMEKRVATSGLEYSLIELVKLRASQINGCAYCVYMHTRDARKAGESEERLYLVSAWRESPLYTVRERAALNWTEALTLIAGTKSLDEDYSELTEQFSEAEIVKLTLLITTINAWNRIAVGFHMVHPVTGKNAAA